MMSEKRKEYLRKYRQTSERKAYMREYCKKNKERLDQRRRFYVVENREKISARYRKYIKKNREKKRQQLRAYYLAHREEILSEKRNSKEAEAYRRKYYDKNRITIRAKARRHSHKKSVIKRQLEREKIYRKTRPEYIFKAAARSKAERLIPLKGKACVECGSKENLHRHHHDYSKPLDVKILCRECHFREHGKMPMEMVI